MKNIRFIIAFLTMATFVTVPQAQPESNIATPVEKTEITESAPDLGQKEKENWQRLREERKLARQQILSDIKASAQAEIKDVHQEIAQQKANNKALIENKGNENKGNARENLIIKENGPRENSPGEWEKHRPENPPFDVPRPDEHKPIRGPKI